jgi:hypothetical protein
MRGLGSIAVGVVKNTLDENKKADPTKVESESNKSPALKQPGKALTPNQIIYLIVNHAYSAHDKHPQQ